jgi:hypothetical protein
MAASCGNDCKLREYRSRRELWGANGASARDRDDQDLLEKPRRVDYLLVVSDGATALTT